MGKKVYVHYEEGADAELHVTLKLTLPAKWASESPLKLLELFVEAYNTRKPANVLDVAQVHLEDKQGVALAANDEIGEVIADRADVHVRHGPTPEGKAKPAAATEEKEPKKNEGENDGKVRCRNYGCNKFFSEDENADDACRHHVKPPLFHDTKKGWLCCEQRVYDFDDFQKIQGCTVGRHSTLDPKLAFAASPTVANAQNAIDNQQPALKSIADYNKENPDAATAVSSALKTANEPTKNVERRSDGTAKCINKGCQKDFVVAENNDKACQYHSQHPVFHDRGKWWACCPDTVKYEFEDFVKIPGCQVGPHNDGFDD